jgi:DNA modification methylase
MLNQLHYGDNLDVLQTLPGESVDLIYLDPPFNSQASYNMLFHAPTGERSRAQIEAFEDTWHWTDEAETAFDWPAPLELVLPEAWLCAKWRTRDDEEAAHRRGDRQQAAPG